MIILYDKDSTSFTSLGIGVLTDFKDIPTITEVLKGEYILEFEYIKFGKYAEYLVDRNLVKAQGQVFRIENVKPSKNGYKVLARHLVFDLRDNYLIDVAPTNKTAHDALNWILERAYFKTNFYATGDCTKVSTARYIRKKLNSAFWDEDNSILNKFGGEPEYDNYHIILHNRRGKDTNVEIREKKNLTGFEMNIDLSTVRTKIMPIGKDGLLLPEGFIDSPLIYNYDTPKIDNLDLDIGVDDETTEEQAYQLMRDAVNQKFSEGLDKPTVSLQVDFVELSKTEEYKNYKNLETISLGDTLRFYMPSLNQRTNIRVIKTVKNALTGRIISLELGNEIPNIVTSQKKNNEVFKNEIILSALEQAKIDATNLINHPFNGHLVISKDTGELFIIDTTDIKTARNVWKWGLGGLGFSSNGINGTYKTAWTQDGGFVADFIASGKINTSLIEGYEQLVTTVSKTETTVEDITTTTQTSIGGNNLYLEDTLESNALEYHVDGKSEQETSVQGKNLFDTPKEISRTINGLTFVVNDDGSVRLTGTSTATTQFYVNLPHPITLNGNYIFSLKVVGTASSNAQQQWLLRQSDNTAVGLNPLIASNDTRANGANLSSTTVTKIEIYTNKDITFDCTIYPQLEPGTAYTEWETFTPNSPSPNYPSEIKSIPSIRNLLNITDGKNEIISGITFTYQDDGSIVLNGTSTQAIAHYNYLTNFKLPAGTYTHSTTNNLISGLYFSLNNINATMLNSFKKQTSWTLESETTYTNYLIYINSGVTLDNYVITPQLEKGSIAHPYVPYGAWAKVKITGKNLFDSLTKVGRYDNNTGQIVDNVTGVIRNINPIYVKANNNYIFSNNGSGIAMNILEYKSDGTFLKRTVITANSSFVTASDTSYINFYRGSSDTDNIQLEEVKEGQTEPTEYEPYQEKEVLIDLNKPNLFDEDNYNYIPYANVDSTGLIISNAGADLRCIYIKVKPNTTYTISADVSRNWVITTTSELPAIGVQGTTRIVATSKTYTLTTNNTTNYLILRQDNSGMVETQNYLGVNLQIYEGYSPYYEISSIGDTKDTLDIVNGQISINENIEKIDSYNGETITTDYISSTGELTIGATVHYILSETRQIILPNNNIPLFEGVNHISLVDDLETTTSIKYYRNTPIAKDYVVQQQLDATNSNLSNTTDKANQNASDINVTNTNLNNNYYNKNQINEMNTSTEKNITQIKHSVEEKMTATDKQLSIINETINNGVSKVVTTNTRFDENGMHMQKDGEEMSSTLDWDGLEVVRDKGKITEEETLVARSSGVIMSNSETKNRSIQRPILKEKCTSISDGESVGLGEYFIGEE